jgi:itaconate CoA-transferase
VRLSMFDAIVEWMTVPFLHAAHGRPPKRVGLAHPSIAPYGVFSSRDGKPILISIQNEREWIALCRDVLGDAAFASDPRFASNVASRFSDLDSAELVTRLSRADIAFAFVNEISDLLGHAQLHTLLVDTPAGPVELPAPAPIWVDGARRYGPVPSLGAHSDSVRVEFGVVRHDAVERGGNVDDTCTRSNMA